MNWTLIRLTKIRLTHQGVTVSILAALVILSRVAYILYNGGNDLKGDFMGFKWLSSFLYSFGVEVSTVLVGITINYSTNFMEEKAKQTFKIFGWSVQMIGFYFMFWIFLDDSVFTEEVEMFFSACFAAVAIIIQVLLGLFFKSEFSKLKGKIRTVMNLLVVQAVNKNLIKDIEVYSEEIINPAINKLSE